MKIASLSLFNCALVHLGFGLSIVLSAPVVIAADPANLEDALVSHRWRWGSDAGASEVEFLRGGKAIYKSQTTSGTEWRWQVTGPRTVHVTQENASSYDLTFDESVTHFKGVGTGRRTKGGYRMDAVASAAVPPVAPQPPPPSPPPPAPPSALPPQKELPMIEVLSDQAPNVANWITAPLDRGVPGEIWQNMTFLKEALRDEAVKNPTASAAAYGMAVRLCFTLVADLEERRAAETLSGGDAVLQQKSNLTEWRRDHLTWPMYFLERDERAERQEKGKNTKVFMKELKIQEWANRSRAMRGVIDTQYSQFREALRQSPARK